MTVKDIKVSLGDLIGSNISYKGSYKNNDFLIYDGVIYSDDKGIEAYNKLQTQKAEIIFLESTSTISDKNGKIQNFVFVEQTNDDATIEDFQNYPQKFAPAIMGQDHKITGEYLINSKSLPQKDQITPITLDKVKCLNLDLDEFYKNIDAQYTGAINNQDIDDVNNSSDIYSDDPDADIDDLDDYNLSLSSDDYNSNLDDELDDDYQPAPGNNYDYTDNVLDDNYQPIDDVNKTDLVDDKIEKQLISVLDDYSIMTIDENKQFTDDDLDENIEDDNYITIGDNVFNCDEELQGELTEYIDNLYL